MALSKYSLLLGLLIVMVVTGLFGSHFGYTVNGVPQGGVLMEEAPGVLGIFSWVWSGITFMFQMVTFRVDGMPIFIGVIFGVMSVMVVFLIVSLVRGSN